MSDHDRGAYSPQSDAPLAFDARQSGGGGRSFPTTLVVSLVILAILIVAIVLFYRSGVRGANDGPLPVGAPVPQIKAPAPKEAQPADAATGLQIYKTEGAATTPPPAPTFTAPPEAVLPRPTAPTVTPAAGAAATGATTPAKPVAKAAGPKDEIGDLLDESAAPKSVAKPAAKPVVVAKAAVPVAAQPIDAKPVVVKPVAAKPVAAKPVAAKPAAAPAATAAAAGAASVQIGAYSSQELAAKGWSDLAGAYGGDMKGKGKHFEPVTRDGKTLYRAAVTGFASKDSAVAFCAKLKAAGHACIVK